jgi:RNA recognition motif-containing protein
MAGKGREFKVFVGNLPWSATEDALWNKFGEQGEVTFVRLVTDRDTGRSKGFGFVSFKEESAHAQAIAKLNGSDWDGRQMTVRVAEDKKEGGTPERGAPAGGATGSAPCFAFQKGNCVSRLCLALPGLYVPRPDQTNSLHLSAIRDARVVSFRRVARAAASRTAVPRPLAPVTASPAPATRLPVVNA